MKKIIFTIATILCASLILATPIAASAKGSADLEWVNQFGTDSNDYGFGLTLSPSGESYVIGYTNGALPGQSAIGGSDAYVVKFNNKGKILWLKQFGTSSDDAAAGIVIEDTAVYIVGDTYGAFSGQDYLGSDDAYVAKFNSKGSMVWIRQFGTSSSDWTSGVSIGDSNVYVAGGTGGTLSGQVSAGADDGFVAKFDVSGNVLWVKQFGTSSRDQVAGLLAKDSAIYLIGNTSGTFPGQVSSGREDMFLAKFDASGNMLWVKQFGTSSGDEVYSISSDSSGPYLVGFTYGAFPGQNSSGDFDAFIAKFDFSGNMVWVRQFGTETYDSSSGVDTADPGIYVAGVTWGTLQGKNSVSGDDSFVAKYDGSGNMLWLRQFGTKNNDYVYGIAANSSGVYVAGQTNGVFKGEKSSGGVDAFIAKLKKTSVHIPSGWDEGKKSGWDGTKPPSSENNNQAKKGKGHKIGVAIG